MAREDIEAGRPVCRSFNCSDEIGDLAAKVFREFDNLEVLVESKSPAQETEDRGLLCPSFNSYSCSDKLADIAVKVIGEFDQLPSLERKSSTKDHTEDDDDFTFAPVPKLAHKFYFGPVYPVFNRDLLMNDFNRQRDLEAVEEKSQPTTGTASSGGLTLNELFKEIDGRRFAMPSSTSSNSTRSSSANNNWKLRDIFRRTNSTEGQTTMSSSNRISKNKRQGRSWVDRCLGNMRLLLSAMVRRYR